MQSDSRAAVHQLDAPVLRSRYKLIAHRGGVVEDDAAENTVQALEVAWARGYRSFEIDLRETRDGTVILFHEEDLKLFCGDDRRLRDVTWDQLQQLSARAAKPCPLLFAELLEAWGERASFMLDCKRGHSRAFPATVHTILREHGLESRCLIIGSPAARRYFWGKASVSARSGWLRWASAVGLQPARDAFLFDHGVRLSNAQVRWAQARGIRIIATVNRLHYLRSRKLRALPASEREQIIHDLARQDIDRLKAAGVEEFQIDSAFEDFFVE